MYNKEELQIDKYASKYNASMLDKQKKMILCESWQGSGPQDSFNHFVFTLSDAMELVRNLGHKSWARHRIWLGQHGQATEFGIS